MEVAGTKGVLCMEPVEGGVFMRFNQKILMVLLMIGSAALIMCMLQNASAQLTLCACANGTYACSCGGDGGGGGGEGEGGGGVEGSIVSILLGGMQEAGCRFLGILCPDGGSGDCVPGTRDYEVCLLRKTGGQGDSGQQQQGGPRQLTPEEEEAARARLTERERQRQREEVQRRQEEDRSQTAGRQTLDGVTPGQVFPKGETFGGGQAPAFHEGGQDSLPPAVIGDPVDVFSSRPVVVEKLDDWMNAYNNDTTQVSLDFEEFVFVKQPPVGENIDLADAMRDLHTVFLRENNTYITCEKSIPRTLRHDVERGDENSLTMSYECFGNGEPFKADVATRYWEHTVDMLGAVLTDAHGNVRRFDQKIPYSYLARVTGDPCWNAERGVTVDQIDVAISVLALSSVEDASGYPLFEITYETVYDNGIPGLIQRIRDEFGRDITVERKYFMKGPYETRELNWYQLQPGEESNAYCGDIHGGRYNRWLSATNSGCISLYRLSSKNASVLPDECYWARSNYPPRPECLRNENPVLPAGGPPVGERVLWEWAVTFGEGVMSEWIVTLDRMGVYYYLLSPVVARVTNSDGEFTFNYQDNGGGGDKKSRPLLTSITRIRPDGTRWVKQSYIYTQLGDETYLSELQDADGRTITRWWRDLDEDGDLIVGYQTVGGNLDTTTSYIPVNRGNWVDSTVQNEVITPENVRWLFEKGSAESPWFTKISVGNPQIGMLQIRGERRNGDGQILEQTLADGRTLVYAHRGEGDDIFTKSELTKITEVSSDGLLTRDVEIEYEPRYHKIRSLKLPGYNSPVTYYHCYELDRARCPCGRPDFPALRVYADGRTEEFVSDSHGRIAEYKSLEGVISRIYYTTKAGECSPYGTLR